MFAHLRTQSWFSLHSGASRPYELVEAAALHGQKALAITDNDGFYGAVRFQQACDTHGIKPIFGVDMCVDGFRLLFLAQSNYGYSQLCKCVTKAHHKNREYPQVSFEDISNLDGVFCLTGNENSQLYHFLEKRDYLSAQTWLSRLKSVFGENVYVEICNSMHNYSQKRMRELAELAEQCQLPIVATGNVKYAYKQDYALHDLLLCMGELITVFDDHKVRPRNAEQFLMSEHVMRKNIPFPQAFESISKIVDACCVDLLPGEITPPKAKKNDKMDPSVHLRWLAEEGFFYRYGEGSHPKAEALMEKELAIISELKLEEYFLVVYEIVEEAKRRGIRCSGRGSAANSIICFLLGITNVDPIKHNLLFERFLHRGRKGTPDIDIDFDTERRDEIIHWITNRFGIDKAAMTATVVTYQLRSAFRDVAKALGWDLDTINRVSKLLPHATCRSVAHYKDLLSQELGDSALLETLLRMISLLHDCPRHMGLHSGGMVLSRVALHTFTPVQVSANTVKMVQFDKDDVEALGLIKFDILGLRMLACISECVELIHRHIDVEFDLDAIQFNDEMTFQMIRAGKTLGCFQIESQGQMHLLARNQPDTFDDLIAEIALFRPGPLQGGVVYPFVRRRRGQEVPDYMHPDLEPILKDTYGIILFQEQVLEVVHKFAGLSLEEADRFRQLMSKFRDPGDMQKMRVKFVAGAMGRGVDEQTANHVFEKVSKFVGYGFCRSHAAAFALIVYQSAYLKCHYPAAFMAAFMQHRPGMYNQMTLEEEARRFGVHTAYVDITRSNTRFDLEVQKDGKWMIRKPFTSVEGIVTEDASKIIFERMIGPFRSVEDVYQRIDIHADKLDKLARSGCFDALEGSSRKAFWKTGVLKNKYGKAGPKKMPSLFTEELILPEEIPQLKELLPSERVSWDYNTQGSARVHPITLIRRHLVDLEIRPVEQCYRFSKHVSPFMPEAQRPKITTAGIVILRQRPQTANGFMFVTIEDETGFIQCIASPEICKEYSTTLYHSGLVVQGTLTGESNWAGLHIQQVWALNNTFGGYEGRPSQTGGKDRWIRSEKENKPKENISIDRPFELRQKARGRIKKASKQDFIYQRN